jgi:predicted short-subunit dehydrogenase-like oxidoreductase (DUF2520 family)
MKVGILGSGKVAKALLALLQSKGVSVAYLWARNQSQSKNLAKSYGIEATQPCDADFHFFAVSDDAIAKVAEKFPELDNKVHLSGSLDSEVLAGLNSNQNTGVFWPLRSFASNQDGDWGDSWVFISSQSEQFKAQLAELARSLEVNFQLIDSEQKAELHMQAVVMNNLVNHLYSLCEERLREKHLSLEAFYPIIRQTFEGIVGEGPSRSQSGPALRGDLKTLRKQLKQLSDDPVLYSIYKLISESIIAHQADADSAD